MHALVCYKLISVLSLFRHPYISYSYLLSTHFETRHRGYKTYSMLNSTEHAFLTAHVNYRKIKTRLAFKLSDVFIMLINVKMPTIVGILTF